MLGFHPLELPSLGAAALIGKGRHRRLGEADADSNPTLCPDKRPVQFAQGIGDSNRPAQAQIVDRIGHALGVDDRALLRTGRTCGRRQERNQTNHCGYASHNVPPVPHGFRRASQARSRTVSHATQSDV